MTDGGESYGLFLNSFINSAYYLSRNTVADVIYNINWDSFFNGDNHKYTKCRLRYDFISDNASVTNPFTPTANNGLLLLNGINPCATYINGGLPLGLITVQSITTSTAAVHQSVVDNNFTGTISIATPPILTVTTPAYFMLAVGDTISFRNPNSAYVYETRNVASLTNSASNTYTLSGGSIGATAATAVPISSANPRDLTYTTLVSSNLQSGIGVSIEVPKGFRNLNVQLQNNAYGQTISGITQPHLMSGTNLAEWGLMLVFELYDPVPNEYTYRNN
jgi:hypothetical protein